MRLEKRFIITFLLIITTCLSTFLIIYKLGLKNMYVIGKDESRNTTERTLLSLNDLIKTISTDLDLIGDIIQYNGEDEGFRVASNLLKNKEIYTLVFFTQIENGNYRSMPSRIMESNFDPRKSSWFKETLKNNKITVSSPYYDPVRNLYSFSVSKVIKKTSKDYAIIGVNINMNLLNDILNQNKIGENGYLMLLSKKEGTIMSHPQNNLIGKKFIDLNEKFSKFNQENLSKGFIDYSLNSTQSFLYYSYIPEFDWILTGGTSYKDFYVKYKSIRIIIALSAIVISSLIIFITIYLKSTIINNIISLSNSFKLLATGNFTSEIKITSNNNDEINELFESYSYFKNNIQNILVNIKSKLDKAVNMNGKIELAVEELNNITLRELKEAISKSLDDIVEQSASTQESAQRIELINQGADVVLENVNIALKNSKNAKLGIESSIVQFQEMNGNIYEINNYVISADTEILKLMELSKDIENITIAISSLSEQTNLLALNAAIESARAGEAGKGFAVVSQEIKKLSDKTSNETDKIDNLVKNIKLEIKKVSNANCKIKTAVDQGLYLNKIAKSSIENLYNGIEITNENIMQIEEIVNNQKVATEEINMAMNNISKMSGEIEIKGVENLGITELLSNQLVENRRIINQTSQELLELSKEFKKFTL